MGTYTAKYRINKKQKLIQYKGGKCEKCGYSKTEYPRVFTFHHLDPSKKEFTISVSNVSLEKAKKEVDKCLLLCQNCHSEIHDKPYLSDRASNPVIKQEPRIYSYCNFCNKQLSDKKSQYCRNHKYIITRKYIRPTKEVLVELLKTKTIEDLSKEYKCVGNTIRKWLKAYKLPYKAKELKSGINKSN